MNGACVLLLLALTSPSLALVVSPARLWCLFQWFSFWMMTVSASIVFNGLGKHLRKKAKQIKTVSISQSVLQKPTRDTKIHFFSPSFIYKWNKNLPFAQSKSINIYRQRFRLNIQHVCCCFCCDRCIRIACTTARVSMVLLLLLCCFCY